MTVWVNLTHNVSRILAGLTVRSMRLIVKGLNPALTKVNVMGFYSAESTYA